MPNKPRIGLIGLGIMGSAMARNAAKAGFPVTVFNRSPAPLERAKADGLAVAASAADLASKSDIIAIIVTDPAAVRAHLNGPTGVFAGDVKGKTLIQMSTINGDATMAFAKDAAAHGMKFLDCPVTGSKKQVEDAALILEAGGDKALVDECAPFLRSVGKAIVHAGPVGQGTALKLCMNLIVAQMTTALAEAVAFAKAQGLDPARVFEVIGHSPALNCGYYQIKEKTLLESDFAPAFSLDNMLKDVRFMTDTARGKDLDLPVTEAVRSVMERATAAGYGADDLTGVIRAIRPNGAVRAPNTNR